MGHVVYVLNYGSGDVFEEERPFHSIEELRSMISNDFELALKDRYQASEVYVDRVYVDGEVHLIANLFDRGA